MDGCEETRKIVEAEWCFLGLGLGENFFMILLSSSEEFREGV